MIIKPNMDWPPCNFMRYKMLEHNAWFSGDIDLLANFYNENVARAADYRGLGASGLFNGFWTRQISNRNKIITHVPIAGDIAETSANFLFSESPVIKIAQAHSKNAAAGYKESQDEFNELLENSLFYSKIVEAAEACAAIGGVYIKGAWDQELSKYPIPVIEQADRAIPTFRFGLLDSVIFWDVIEVDGNVSSNSKYYRLLEYYKRGSIEYELYKGTSDKLGELIDLNYFEATKGLKNVDTLGRLLAIYVPNMLPNRLDRNTSLGRSDYCGVESLMDSLDETFSSWARDIVVAQARVYVPEKFLENIADRKSFDVDEMLYVKLNVDPLTASGKDYVTVNQFDIRAEKFEKTSLNLLERIITAAGYSPQSFGLNIQGRAESGTALSIRERKSFLTKNKKEKYWGYALKEFCSIMTHIYSSFLGGGVELDSDFNISFSDSITNDLQELTGAVKMVADAAAASTETKVRMLHPEWGDEQINEEVAKIVEENNIGSFMPNPDSNLDLDEMKFKEKEEDEEE